MATSFTPHSSGQVITAADINLIQTSVNTLENTAPYAPGASDAGAIAWTADPMYAWQLAGRIVTGVLHIMAVYVKSSVTTNNGIVAVGNAGSSINAGQAFAALYNAAGTRVAVTAAQDTTWNSVGLKVMPWASPAALTPGLYWIGLIAAGATLPTFLSSVASAPGQTYVDMVNFGTTVSTLRYGVNGSGLTAAPASITPASNTKPTTAWPYWAAIS